MRKTSAHALLAEICNRNRNSDIRADHPEVIALIDNLLAKIPPSMFYIQNKGYCGNYMKWWRPDGKGYTADLRDAWKVTREQADDICRSRPTEDIAWPCPIVDSVAVLHVTCSLEMRSNV